MVGKLEEKLQERTASTAFQLVWQSLGWLSRLLIDREAVRRGMKQYAKRFLTRYGQVKVLGMSEPVPLRDIYVAAQVVTPSFLVRYSNLASLEEAFHTQGRRKLSLVDQAEPRQLGLALANEEQFLSVLGTPGAGKSTFLRRLGLEALLPRRVWSGTLHPTIDSTNKLEEEAVSQYDHDCLPVLIELRRLRNEQLDLSVLIQEELEICGVPGSAALVESLLNGGRLLLLLDGLDEVPADKLAQTILHIGDFVDRHGHSGNRFVTSCRTAFYKNHFPRFTDMVLADFDHGQMTSFVHNWFRSPEDRQRDTAGSLLQLLDLPAHAAIKELAGTPLLLTFICLNYEINKSLPPNRSELYREALDILMKKWASSRFVHEEPIHQGLTADLEVQMLAELACTSFQDNRYFFTRRELTDFIDEFLRKRLKDTQDLDSGRVLEAIEVHQGLLAQRAQDAWSFSHLTIQEYLTAVWHSDSDKQLEQLANKHLSDVRWREVFILAAGAVREADVLLERMQKAADQRLASASQALRLLTWAGGLVDATGREQEDAARRALGLVLGLVLNLSLAVAQALDPTRPVTRVPEHDRVLASALGLALTLDSTLASVQESARDFAGALSGALESTRSPARVHDSDRLFFDGYMDSVLQLLEKLEASQRFTGPWGSMAQALRALHGRLAADASHEAVRAAFQGAQDILTQGLHLPQELRDLEGATLEALEGYLQACQLLVDCKSAATRCSDWDDICRRMLAPSSSRALASGKRGVR